MTSEPLPLEDIDVVDFGQLIPAPATTLNLAWLGAAVTKVEPPGGDPARALYDGTFFELYNRGKSSLELDLKDPGDRDRALSRCATADVVVEGFRPGVADRLGVGYDAVARRNPDVVYCSITGYGADVDAPAHDLSFLARGGALAQPATYSARGEPPRRPAIPVADLAGAAVATQAVLAALFGRLRGQGGRHLEIAIHEAVLHWVAPRAGSATRGGSPPDPARYLEPANDIYATRDGRHVVIAAIERRHWRALCEALGDALALPEGAAEWDWRQRRDHAEPLARALRAAFASDTRDGWLARLEAKGVPVDPVHSIAEAFGDPWVAQRGLVDDRGWVRPPLPFRSALPAPPRLGEHG